MEVREVQFFFLNFSKWNVFNDEKNDGHVLVTYLVWSKNWNPVPSKCSSRSVLLKLHTPLKKTSASNTSSPTIIKNTADHGDILVVLRLILQLHYEITHTHTESKQEYTIVILNHWWSNQILVWIRFFRIPLEGGQVPPTIHVPHFEPPPS